MKNFLFVHGGPGFNSFAEAKLLKPFFEKKNANIEFWNEPSRLRKDGPPFKEDHAFVNWCGALEDKFKELKLKKKSVHVLAHSFSVHALARLIDSYEDLILDVTLFSSSFGFSEVLLNILGLILEDVNKSHPDKAKELKAILDKKPKFFDLDMQSALQYVAFAPNLFDHYWKNKSIMTSYFNFNAGDPQAQFDMDSFFHVCRDLADVGVSVPPVKSKIPVTAIFGKDDPLVNVEHEGALLRKQFPGLSTRVFEQSCHYPHLEETQHLLKILKLE